MVESIKLVPIESNKITIITGMIYSDETLKNIFSLENLVSRQLNSVYAFKILYKDCVCGFINMIYNERENYIEVDVGIKESYRNKGIGSTTLKMLKTFCINNMAFSDMEIIAQVQKQNIAGIKVLENNGFSKKFENKNYRYYKIKKS